MDARPGEMRPAPFRTTLSRSMSSTASRDGGPASTRMFFPNLVPGRFVGHRRAAAPAAHLEAQTGGGRDDDRRLVSAVFVDRLGLPVAVLVLDLLGADLPLLRHVLGAAVPRLVPLHDSGRHDDAAALLHHLEPTVVLGELASQQVVQPFDDARRRAGGVAQLDLDAARRQQQGRRLVGIEQNLGAFGQHAATELRIGRTGDAGGDDGQCSQDASNHSGTSTGG